MPADRGASGRAGAHAPPYVLIRASIVFGGRESSLSQMRDRYTTCLPGRATELALYGIRSAHPRRAIAFNIRNSTFRTFNVRRQPSTLKLGLAFELAMFFRHRAKRPICQCTRASYHVDWVEGSVRYWIFGIAVWYSLRMPGRCGLYSVTVTGSRDVVGLRRGSSGIHAETDVRRTPVSGPRGERRRERDGRGARPPDLSESPATQSLM